MFFIVELMSEWFINFIHSLIQRTKTFSQMHSLHTYTIIHMYVHAMLLLFGSIHPAFIPYRPHPFRPGVVAQWAWVSDDDTFPHLCYYIVWCSTLFCSNFPTIFYFPPHNFPHPAPSSTPSIRHTSASSPFPYPLDTPHQLRSILHSCFFTSAPAPIRCTDENGIASTLL